MSELAEIHRIVTLRTLLPWTLSLALSAPAAIPQTAPATPKHPAPAHHHHPAHTATHGKTAKGTGHVRHIKSHHKPRSARSIARSRKLQQAFVASSQLRPMAQELTAMRSPAAYAGVSAYAHAHSGEAASAAYLALGHAYLADHRYPEASPASRKRMTRVKRWTTMPIF